jgi:hypothetical protein
LVLLPLPHIITFMTEVLEMGCSVTAALLEFCLELVQFLKEAV